MSKRRIINETKYALKNGYYLNMDLSIPEIIIYPLTFKPSESYPFKPPMVYYKNKSYLSFLQDVTNMMSCKYCLCCQSILCPAVWNATKKMTDVVKEYYFVRDKISQFLGIKFLHIWLDKKNMGFVNLAPYLFHAKEF